MNKEPSITNKNYGIELLRILSMFFIVVLHVIGQGGILGSSMQFSKPYIISNAFLAFSYCAVNCYALISGYVSCKSRFKLSRLITLWLSVVVTNVTIWALTHYFFPQWQISSFYNAFLPVSQNQYWYFTAYVGLLILMPALNAAVNNIPKKQYTVMLIGMLVLFVILPIESSADLFYTHSGYSMLWLVLMYITGAYFRLHLNKKIPFIKTICFVVYVLSAVAIVVFRLYKEKLLADGGSSYPYFAKYYTYTSLFVVVSGLALFLLFLNINVKNKYIQKIIGFFSKSTFGVYIIHTNIIVWMYVLSGRFAHQSLYSPTKLCLYILADAAVIYIACTAFEKIRAVVFKLFGIAWNTLRKPFVK